MEGNLKRVMTLVRRRRSVRTFDGNPLREEDAAKILEFARREKNPYGIPIDWQMLSADKDGLTTPVIIGADTFFTGKMHPVEHAEEAFGYALERIVLYAQSMGIGSTWIAGTMDRPAFERAIGLAEDEVMPCVTPLGYPAEKMSLREGMMRKGVKADSRLPFDQLFFEGSFERPLQYGADGDFSDLLEIVRWAPSAVNKQPWRLVVDQENRQIHLFEKQSRGYVSATGWDLQKVDMGIALCHLMLGLKEMGYEPAVEVADPGITAPQDTKYVVTCRW